MPALTAPGFSIRDFLDEEREKDLLRFSTAGSVDDGKSTLIGRLLYDTQSVYEDQVRVDRRQRHNRSRTDRFRPAHRRPPCRARTRHHHRCRLSLLLYRAAQIHHRRHAGARAVHAQHGDGRINGRCIGGAYRRGQGRAGTVAPPRVYCFAAARAPHPCRREQDGPDRLRRATFPHYRTRLPPGAGADRGRYRQPGRSQLRSRQRFEGRQRRTPRRKRVRR